MKTIKNFSKGMIIGISILIPGVSGGTMAIILGIYEDLIHAFSSLTNNWKHHRKLLLQVVLGVLFSIKTFSYLIEEALNKYPEVMNFIFIGIILGGMPTLYKKYKTAGKKDIFDYVFSLLGFSLVLILSAKFFAFNSSFTQQGAVFYLLTFVVGIIIAVALILPGISGSLILMTIGMYGTTINAINEFDFLFLTPLILGIIAGILGGSRVIEGLIKEYPGKTYMLILGFVIASVIPIFPGIPTEGELFSSIIAFMAGLIAILCWCWFSDLKSNPCYRD